MKYEYLYGKNMPRIIVEALKLNGIKEIAGPKHEKAILDWAKTLGLKNYTSDEIAWCGLLMGIVVHRSGYTVVKNPLWADNWRNFGDKVDVAMIGDLLGFSRPGGNHIGLYCGENKHSYLVYGGNQSNKVGFAWIEKSRLTYIRRCPWAIGQPEGVKQVILNEEGEISKNEA